MVKDKNSILNEEIKYEYIILIDENGKNIGKTKKSEALFRASEKGLDLWQVSETSPFPICKIVNYGKILYDQNKKNKNNHSHHEETKEIKIKYKTDDHDIKIKHNKILSFLEDHYKVKYSMLLIGRECSMYDLAYQKMNNLLSDFVDYAEWDKIQKSSVGFDKISISVVMKPKNKK